MSISEIHLDEVDRGDKDLVRRLRNIADSVGFDGLGFIDVTCHEAADKIERLSDTEYMRSEIMNLIMNYTASGSTCVSEVADAILAIGDTALTPAKCGDA